jgi:hypothetical protein
MDQRDKITAQGGASIQSNKSSYHCGRHIRNNDFEVQVHRTSITT